MGPKLPHAPLYGMVGSGKGLARLLAPQVRIYVAAMAFACCLLSPSDTLAGMALILAVATLWTFACLPPVGLVTAWAVIGLIAFGPYLLLTPFIPDRADRVTVTASIILRGTTCTIVGLSTISCLDMMEWLRGLASTCLPQLAVRIITQVMQQSCRLWEQTRRVALAIVVRTGTAGWSKTWSLAKNLPVAWFPRVVWSAERVAAVMEVRGLCVLDLKTLTDGRLGLLDLIGIAAGLAALGTAVLLRVIR